MGEKKKGATIHTKKRKKKRELGLTSFMAMSSSIALLEWKWEEPA